MGSMIDIDKEIIEADVLIAGGGIGGLMAAISAADEGVSVVVAEKANTKRSGSGATVRGCEERLGCSSARGSTRRSQTRSGRSGSSGWRKSY